LDGAAMLVAAAFSFFFSSRSLWAFLFFNSLYHTDKLISTTHQTKKKLPMDLRLRNHFTSHIVEMQSGCTLGRHEASREL
jgi:hypothetical protein